MLSRCSLWSLTVNAEASRLPLLHTVEYVGLAILIYRALDGDGLEGRWSAIVTVCLVSAYGASDEWHQSFVPLRDSDVYDWLTDTLAGVIGATACLLFRRAYDGRREPTEPGEPQQRSK